MSAIIAQWRQVTKRYREVLAVENVSLRLQAGETTALVGHNGAGKTTLIKLLLGLVRPSAGSVSIDGANPAGRRGVRARHSIGFLPENVAFHGAMTGRELMAFYARLKGAAARRNDELLARVGIADAARRRVATYSKGMRQRLGIAQALIGEPRLLLFDEPTSGLDPQSRQDVYETIDRLRAEGATVLVSTHALAEIENRVDRVAIMHRGRLLAAGTLAELREGVRADVRIRAKVKPGTRAKVLAAVAAHTRSVESVERTLTLHVSAEAKMPALHALAQCGEQIEDIDIVMPGLESLYNHLTGAPAPPT